MYNMYLFEKYSKIIADYFCTYSVQIICCRAVLLYLSHYYFAISGNRSGKRKMVYGNYLK